MGILNVTPDSFSDGGLFLEPEDAIARGRQLIEEGADIIDVGGESTRPGSSFVDVEEEKRRVLPVLEALLGQVDKPLSVDTVKPEVARAAAEAGVHIINDVSMLRNGVELAAVAAEFGTELVLMHSRKTPRDMQEDINYADVVRDVIDELLGAARSAITAGVEKERIWLDPGIGFAKTAEHNIELLARLDELVATGFPILVGPSRKSFIGKIGGDEAGNRLGGTAAALTVAIMRGARVIRIHDVATMRQASRIAHACAKMSLRDAYAKECRDA